VDEDVLAAGGRLNEAVAALVVVPFHCALVHQMSSQSSDARLNGRANAARPVLSIFWGS
jgi:hypothetical protein